MSPTARVRRWTRFVLDFAFFAAFCAMVYTTWEIKSKAFELLRLRTEQIQTLEKITRTQQEMIDAQNDVINIMIDDSSIPCEMPPRELRSTTRNHGKTSAPCRCHRASLAWHVTSAATRYLPQ